MPVKIEASRTIDTREESREQTLSKREPKEENENKRKKCKNWMIKLMLLVLKLVCDEKTDHSRGEVYLILSLHLMAYRPLPSGRV